MVSFASTPVSPFVGIGIHHAVTTSLMAEIRRHGPALVAQNRMLRTNRLEQFGRHEEADQLEHEGDVALALVDKLRN
jgi:hypothetical protein